MPSTDRDPRSRPGRGRLAAFLQIAALALVVPSLARSDPNLVKVVDAYGHTLTTGSVVFCPLDSECLEFLIATDGTIALDRARLEPGTSYTVMVYTVQRSVLYAKFGWIYEPAAFEAAEAGPGTIELRGNFRQEIEFDFAPKVAPAGQAAPETPLKPAKPSARTQVASRPLATPRGWFGACAVFVFGDHFRDDIDALGGVTEVEPGLGFFAAYRFGYPPAPSPGQRAVGFREISVSYAFNRYTVRELADPGATSDLTFHRANLAFGVGRLTARTFLSASLAVGYGGIYDGGELLEYRDRTYRMVGFGVQARAGYALFRAGSHGVGLFGQAELMHYPADTGDDDHWYGPAASLAAGIVVH
ncbi:MAG TPA: hypothetical protein PLL30_14125 [Candidatus Krumholzibacteria bacterium]|nr:hypothetical protein [Candidatus Krumholzibacteria bacterium]HPD72903.1 hypothetical protein [Candidatus Krumholzibacteria bacterium]HRY41702.1 hypothetical protein [Candidatus Krumholzibacteria bacterium]